MAKKPTRRLFLDDDPSRASSFLERHPDAVWVETSADCVAKLAEAWDEVHLDHDLGGEVYVESTREDCGMEVVRWLSKEPRPHLRKARFTVHSHNPIAAFEMTYRLRGLGYRAEARPFGVEAPRAAKPWDKLRLGVRDLIRRIKGDDPSSEPEADSPDHVP